MQEPPFAKPHQLNHELDFWEPKISSQVQLQPLHLPGQPQRLPGQPQIHMNQTVKIQEFLDGEFLLHDLEEISPYLWMMSKHDSRSISPLHRQKVKGREIIVTEDPRLHLIWRRDRIFIKPLPKYLLSYSFWHNFLFVDHDSTAERKALRRATLGYLRTYFHLIKYESDFRIAIDDHLIPSDITFSDFCDFIAPFEYLPDAVVSGRYSYGEIRLTRLNLYSKVFLGKLNFHRVHAHYSDYFASFYGPLLFVFAMVSVVLSAMQLGMAVESVETNRHRRAYWDICNWFNIICINLVVVLALWLALLFLGKFVKEWVYAINKHRKRKHHSNV